MSPQRGFKPLPLGLCSNLVCCKFLLKRNIPQTLGHLVTLLILYGISKFAKNRFFFINKTLNGC